MVRKGEGKFTLRELRFVAFIHGRNERRTYRKRCRDCECGGETSKDAGEDDDLP